MQVGRFIYDEAASTVSGPADYMREQGSARLDAILAGNDPAFNASVQFSPDPVTAVLVQLQTDYAGWKGLRDFNARLAS